MDSINQAPCFSSGRVEKPITNDTQIAHENVTRRKALPGIPRKGRLSLTMRSGQLTLEGTNREAEGVGAKTTGPLSALHLAQTRNSEKRRPMGKQKGILFTDGQTRGRSVGIL